MPLKLTAFQSENARQIMRAIANHIFEWINLQLGQIGPICNSAKFLEDGGSKNGVISLGKSFAEDLNVQWAHASWFEIIKAARWQAFYTS
jgi:hypothetical protein